MPTIECLYVWKCGGSKKQLSPEILQRVHARSEGPQQIAQLTASTRFLRRSNSTVANRRVRVGASKIADLIHISSISGLFLHSR